MSRRNARGSRRNTSGANLAVELAGLEAYLAANLFAWRRADSRTEAAAKVTQFNDRVNPGVGARAIDPNHCWAQATSGNQVAAVAADATLRNLLVATLVGASDNFYDSSIAATNWKFLHDGTGMNCVTVVNFNNASTRSDMEATRAAAGAGEVGFLLDQGIAVATARAFCQDGAASAVDTGNVGTIPSSAWLYLDFSYVEGGSPEYVFRQKTTTIASGSSATAPSAADPGMTQRFGKSGAFPSTMKWADTLFFKGTPSAALTARIQRYLFLRYGL